MSPFNINFNNKKAHVNAADRPAFIEEFHKKYVEEEKAKEAANPTSDNHKKLLDSLEDATSKSRLRKREREATRTRAYNTLLNSLKTRDDFEELAERGAAKGDDLFGLGNKVQHSIDKSQAQADFLRQSGVAEENIGKGYIQNPYDYMTQEQLNIYNAFIGLGDRNSARRYLQSIEPELNQKAAEAILPNRQNDGLADTFIMGADAGAQSYVTGNKQLGSSTTATPSYQEMLYNEVRPELEGKQALAADVGNIIGFQLIPVAGSMLLGTGAGAGSAKAAIKTVRALSSAAMGASAGGNAYREALQKASTNQFDAKVYGIVNGALEGYLNYALGGIKAFGSGGVVKAAGKLGLDKAVAKKLSNVAKAAATTPAVKNFIRGLVAGGQLIGGSADEFTEEWLQAVLDVPVRNYILGENNEIKPFSEDKLYAGLLGALVAGATNAVNVPSDFKNADQTIQNALIEKPKRNKGGAQAQPANLEAKALPEATKEQIEAHMDDPAVRDLVAKKNQLEAALPKDKKRHAAGRSKMLDFVNQSLAARIAALEATPERGQTASEPFPEMPKAPVENEEALETLSRELESAQAEDEGTTEAFPTEEKPKTGEQYLEEALQLQEELGLNEATAEEEPAPAKKEPFPEEEVAPTEEEPSEPFPEEEAPVAEEEEGEGYTREELIQKYKDDVKEAATYRDAMDGTKRERDNFYKSYVRNLDILFRSDAAKLGMSKAEIEAVINGEGSTTSSINREEKVAFNPVENATEAVTDEDIEQAFGPTEDRDELRGFVETIQNEDLTTDEAVDELEALLNQRDIEREAAGEAVGEAVEPEVTITEGRIEVRFPNWPGKEVTDELQKNGFRWDKKARVWHGGENDYNKALVERLTGVKLTEDEFKPTVKRIPKEELNNGTGEGSLLRNTSQRGTSDIYSGDVSDISREAENEIDKRQSAEYANQRYEKIKASGVQPKWNNRVGYVYEFDQQSLPEEITSDPAWKIVNDILEQKDIEQQGRSKEIDFVFYAPADGINNDHISYYNPDDGRIWVNLASPTLSTYDGAELCKHEYFHALIYESDINSSGDSSTLFDFVHARLIESGLSNKEIERVITEYIAPRWDHCYGEVTDPVAYRYYMDELMSELYSRNSQTANWISNNTSLDITQLQDAVIGATIRFAFGWNGVDGVVQNAKDSGLLLETDLTDNKITSNIYNFSDNTIDSDTNHHSTTAEENLDKLTPENREALEPLENSEYETESMEETTSKSEEWLRKHGAVTKDGATDYTQPYSTLMNKKGEWKPTEMEAGLTLFSHLAQDGDMASASALAAKIIGQAPDFGRVINYFKILQRYLPDAISSISRSIADDIGVELSEEERGNIELCDRIAKQGFISNSVMEEATPEFREWLQIADEYVDRGQLDATTAAYAAAMTLVTDKQPSTARQKFRALQRISLLSNPKTHFRNILGNVAEQAGSIMSRPIADLTDRIISKKTNQRTFGSGGGEAFAKAMADSVEKAVMDHVLGINTVGNKFDEDTTRHGIQQLARQNAFDEKTHKALRNGISRVANNIDHLIGLGLSIGDAPFLIGTYEAALAQIMNANNATEATEEMMDTAWDVAFRRTFRDNNAVTKALTGIRNSLPFIGETIAPYVQTPVNVVLTAIQYSPIGVGEAFFKAFVDLGGNTSLRTQLKNNESTMKTQRQIAELVGRGALGTAAMLVGALLASAGRITGDDDDIDSQKEKNWNTATGRKGSSIKIGDTYIDPSSLQSLSTPIMAGAAAYEGKEEGDGTDWAGILGAAVKASMKMGNTMLEMPVLQGVADLFSGNYDNGELLAGALSLAGNAATQVVPFGSLLKQAGKAVDPYSRVQSEINAGPGERVLKSTVNNLKTMLPGTRKTLSQRYDVLGNPIKNDASDNVAERLYNSFINPFNTSKENTNEVTDEIDRLYAALQDTDVLPSAAGNSISYGGEKYKFTSAEKQEYQRVEGESNAEILSSLVNSEAYDQLTDEEKAKVLSSIYDYSSNKAKADYLKKQGVEYESDAKWMDSIDSIVETGVDIGSAMVYRYELNQIDGADEQAKYIMSLPISADQKKAFDTQFVDKFGFHPITDDRDYTSEDTLALSMTSDSGRGKYDRVFSGDWTAPSGNSYRSLSGVEFGELYDACYFKSSPTKAESIESIRKMLMEEWGLDGYAAETLATDFRAVMGSKKY